MQQQLNVLFEPLKQWDGYHSLLKSVNKGKDISCAGLSESRKVHFACLIIKETGKKAVYVASNEYSAVKAYEDFSFFLGDRAVLIEPSEYMLYDVEAQSHDASNKRMKAIVSLVKGDWDVVVVSCAALMQYMPPPDELIKTFITIKTGDIYDITDLIARLVRLGYERVAQVSGRGQFAVRGDILDIYPSSSELPFRIEFFDNEIEQLRTFDIASQRTISSAESVLIIPDKETLIRDDIHETAVIERIKESLDKVVSSLKEYGRNNIVRRMTTLIESDIEKLKSKSRFPGYDKYIPFILGRKYSIFDYTGDTYVFMDNPDSIYVNARTIIEDHLRICDTISDKKGLLPETYNMYMDETDIQRITGNYSRIDLVNKDTGDYVLPSKSVLSFTGNTQLFYEQIKKWIEDKYTVVILVNSESRIKRLESMLEAEGISPTGVIIKIGGLQSGFEYPDFKFAVVSDSSLFKKETGRKKYARKDGKPIQSFAEINVGDYVVHDTYGIGIFTGLETIDIGDVKRDYIRIKYDGSESLFIPTEQLSEIQKYIGSEEHAVKLNKLSGNEWKRATGKVKESLRAYAKELVELYAKRSNTVGYSYSKDTVWQKEFEESFPYEETDDQLKCSEEIKDDMEKPIPMERLLCGDVGYGKTEVALRSAFKAICDNKQVAFLVPTTVLAQQHYKNFIERFKDFPVKVEHLSRFRTAAEKNKILKELKSGTIDLLVGTHSIIQKQIQFKDLGLLIIDEEQRFGVMHKERLKTIWPGVDILTLSATPIPRTLHMSLTGIRDISIIQEPPGDRYPVQTYVTEWDEPIIRNAIYREMSRKGQIFYLYNRVRTIEEKKKQLEGIVPEARIVVAHGQMAERTLEETMIAFSKGEFDILLCTTIIESGLDMPNVNTIIVEDGDKLGLAQLYQIRGRVGRSDRMAYAYITYKKDKELNEIAEKRLNTIREFTEFGSGFKIALRDLEIRGAGSVLGEKQHGQLATVGYEMYCRLLGEVVMEEQGLPYPESEPAAKVEFPVNAFIEPEYIEDEEARLEIYKKIAGIQNENDVLEITDELIDRFGDVPESVYNLIQISYIRYLAGKCSFQMVNIKQGNVNFYDKNGNISFSIPAKNKQTANILKDTVAILSNILLKNKQI